LKTLRRMLTMNIKTIYDINIYNGVIKIDLKTTLQSLPSAVMSHG